jgi:hypothetical protein
MSAISIPLMPAAVPSAVVSLAEIDHDHRHHPAIAVASAPAARKRRREDEEDSDDACTEAMDGISPGLATTNGDAAAVLLFLPPPLVAASPIVTVLPSRGGASSNKRPQLKYDPSVPMTREQTSAWRREQRRKRNRESAAACRRRQRELVYVLEVEASCWRRRFESALSTVRDRDGDDVASALEAELGRTHVLQPRRTTDEDDDECGVVGAVRDSPSPPPPPARRVPDGARSSCDNVVSPSSRDRSDGGGCAVERRLASTGDDDLLFPILEDRNIKVEGIRFADQNPIVIQSRVKENRRHLNELITTSAEVKRLLRGALGDWTVDFASLDGYGTLTQ